MIVIFFVLYVCVMRIMIKKKMVRKILGPKILLDKKIDLIHFFKTPEAPF